MRSCRRQRRRLLQQLPIVALSIQSTCFNKALILPHTHTRTPTHTTKDWVRKCIAIKMSIYLVIIALVVVAAAAVALAAIVCVCGMLSPSFSALLSLPVCICVRFIHFHTHTCSFCSLYNWNKIYLWLFVARCFGWLSGCLGLRVKGREEGGRLLSSCSFLSLLVCMCVCVCDCVACLFAKWI